MALGCLGFFEWQRAQGPDATGLAPDEKWLQPLIDTLANTDYPLQRLKATNG